MGKGAMGKGAQQHALVDVGNTKTTKKANKCQHPMLCAHAVFSH